MSLAGKVQPPLIDSLNYGWIEQFGSDQARGLVAGIENLHFGSGKMISEISHCTPEEMDFGHFATKVYRLGSRCVSDSVAEGGICDDVAIPGLKIETGGARLLGM
jgi:hypothetical protein